MQQSILNAIKEAFEKGEKISLLVQEFFPISDALVTEINSEQNTIVVVAAAYNGYTQKSQLRKYILDMSVVKGVGIVVSSVEDKEDSCDFDDLDDLDDLDDSEDGWY
jgi:hypothetical protein